MDEQKFFKDKATSTQTSPSSKSSSSTSSQQDDEIEDIASDELELQKAACRISFRKQVKDMMIKLPMSREEESLETISMRRMMERHLHQNEERLSYEAALAALNKKKTLSKLSAPLESSKSLFSKALYEMQNTSIPTIKLDKAPLSCSLSPMLHDSNTIKPTRERSLTSSSDSESTIQEAKRVCPSSVMSIQAETHDLLKSEIILPTTKKFKYIDLVDTTAEQTQIPKFNRLNLKDKNSEISLLAVLGQSGIEIFETRTSSSEMVSLQTIKMHIRHVYISCDWSESRDHKYSPRLAIGSDSGTVSMVLIKFDKTYTFDYRPNIFLFKNNAIEHVLFHPSDENLLFITHQNVISLFNIRSKICAFAIHRHDDYNCIKSIDIDKNGKYIASSSFASNLITVWNVDINNTVIKEHIENSYGTCSKDEKIEDFLVASTKLNDYNGSFRIKDSISQHTEHTSTIDCIKWYGGVIISKDLDGNIIVWGLKPPSIDRNKYFILTKMKVCNQISPFNMFFDVNYEHRMMVLASKHDCKTSVWDLSVPVFEQIPKYDIPLDLTTSCIRAVSISKCGKQIICVNRSQNCIWRLDKID